MVATLRIANRDELTPQVLASMHEFRREIFVRRLRWSLPLIGGIECDEYDQSHTVYVMLVNASNEVTACARLLPTTGSYMLPQLFPQLLGSMPAPNDPSVWELSRFATNTRATKEGRVLSLAEPTVRLIDSVFVCARQRAVQRLVWVTSIALERLLLRRGYDVHRICSPALIEGVPSVALYIEVPHEKNGNVH